ncbi:MAG: DMT family transporter [Candidatus Puniceispirillaceae bacterium]|jgi:drug/metabolite transporter (DMT)-like permease
MTTPTINHQMHALEWGMLLLLGVIWGGSFFLNAVAVRELPVLTIVLGRVGIAAVILLLVIRLKGIKIPLTARLWMAFAIMGLFNNVLPFGLIVWAQGHVASGQAAIINATTPIFAAIMAHVMTADEKISMRQIIGIVTGIAGVAVMMGEAVRQEAGAVLAAQCALLGASLSYGFVAAYGRRFRGLGVSPLVTATGQVTMASLCLLPLVLMMDRPWMLPVPSGEAVLAVVAIAVICTAFAYGLYFRILASAGATNLSLVTMLVPASAILLGILFLGEHLLVHHLMGLGLIIGGLTVMDGRLPHFIMKLVRR